MKYLLVALLGITTAFAQSEPVTRIKGDKDTGYKIAPNLVVPNKQATKLTSTSVRIETGNGNMLPDPSFESGVLPPSSDPTAVGQYKFGCNVYGTASVITSSIANDGTKALKLSFGQGSGAFEGICGYTTILPANLAGTAMEFSIEGSFKNDIQVCVESFQITPTSLSQAPTCFNINEAGGVNKRYVFPYTPLYNYFNVLFRRLNTADTTTPREIEVDIAYHGKPKSDEAIVAKFDNISSISTYTPTITGCTVDTVDFSYQRFQNYLKINGRLRCVTPQASLFTLSLPSGLTIDSRFSTKILEGTGSRSLGSSTGNKDHVLLYYSSNTIAFGVRENPSTLDTVNAQNGSALFTANNTFYIQANLPIAEWSSQTNAAIVACQEGDLKCKETFLASVSATGVISDTNADWIQSVTLSGTNNARKAITFKSNLFTVPPVCVVSSYGCGVQTSGCSKNVMIANLSKDILTTVSILNNDSAYSAEKITIACSKTGVDSKNPNETVRLLENFYVDANEIVVGYDRIDNKTIYQRCHKITSNVYTNGVTFTTWAPNLRLLNNPVTKQDGTFQVIDQWIFLDGSTVRPFSIVYEPSTGVVSSYVVNPAVNSGVRAGDFFCAEYIKN